MARERRCGCVIVGQRKQQRSVKNGGVARQKKLQRKKIV
jgi:hypothetical protein